MKKSAFLFVSVVAICSSTAALAQAASSATSNIYLKGAVPQACYLTTPNAAGDGSPIVSGNDTTMNFDNFVNSNGGHSAHSLQVTYPGAACNYAAHLSLKSMNGGMKPSGTAPSGFAPVINYQATAVWGSGAGAPTTKLVTGSQTNQTSGDNNGVTLPIIVGDLVVTVTTTPTALPLIATGSPYQDTLAVQIGASL